MSKHFNASMVDRSIGRRLRMWRDAKGHSLTEAAKLAHFSAAKLSIMENAVQPLDPLDIMCIGHITDRPGPEWKEQARRAESEAARRATTQAIDKASLFNADEDFIEAFPEASVICTFGAHAIPFVLQPFAYSLSIHEDRISPQRAQLRDDARETLLGSANSVEAFAIYAVIAERALRRPLSGGPHVANAALVHLMELSAHHNVTIQVLESDATFEAWLKHSYSHLTFPHVRHDDVVYLQDSHPGRYIEDPAICNLVRQSFQVLRQSALSPDASLERIAEISGETTEKSYWQAVSSSIVNGGK